MKFIRLFIVIFIFLTTSIKADLNKNLINQLKDGEKLIFIRHAYAPGSGDPKNFNLYDCSTQRNLNKDGKLQALKIGKFFKDNQIGKEIILSSEWCRCKDTARLAFNKFMTADFLNSFYSSKFAKNKNRQIFNLKKYIKNYKGKKNLIFITHYVVISEVLDYASSSGEIVVSDKNFNIIGTLEINY